MKLIFAQGNPGPEYKNNRHNIGFMAIDFFAKKHGAGEWQKKDKFKAEMAELPMNDEKIILVKPTTFYNLTGESARAICDFYKVSPENLLVIHDDLDIDFGSIRIRHQGSDAGNKGIRSLNAHLGQDYYRVRIGIKNDLTDRVEAPDFVLSNFTKIELDQLSETILPKTSQIVEDFIANRLKPTSYRQS